MTSKEFVIWMKGFVEACNDFTATPKQWDSIKEVLSKVTDETTSKFSVSSSGTTAVRYPQGSTWTYTNGENLKQQLND